MLLAYLDESYDKVEYWLTALLVPADNALVLQRALDTVVSDAAVEYNVPVDAELHGHALVHGKEDWQSIAPLVRARMSIYSKALQAIAACEGAAIAMRGIDVQRHNDRYKDPWHPHRVALDFMAQTLNGMAKGRCEYFLTIADEIDQADTLRASYWDFQRHGTLNRWSGKADSAVDALHFAPSKHSRLLQAADLVSYLHFRMRRSNVTNSRALRANQELWDLIAPMLKVWHLWP